MNIDNANEYKVSDYVATYAELKKCTFLYQQLATGWTVRGSNSCGGEIFRTCPDRPWGPPSLLYNGYRVFPGGKLRPGCAADHSPPSSAVMEG